MARPRDVFLDGLRTVSILRVFTLHMLVRGDLPAATGLSFIFPGMPLLFFVSGTAAAWSLEAGGRETLVRFWRSRARRLLLPFWGFGLALVSLAAVLEIQHPEPYHQFRLGSLWNWIVPLTVPQLSPALEKLDGHLWFLSALLLLLASAPLTLALHRRLPFAGALVFGLVGVALEIVRLARPELASPALLRQTLLFGSAFQLGYGYADGSLARMRRGVLVWLALLLGGFACWFHSRVAPGQPVPADPIAQLALGLAFVALCFAFRSTAERVFAWPLVARLRAAVNPRIYTIYLWGPIANELARRAVNWLDWGGTPLYLLLAVLFLVGLALVCGPLEAWAARRQSADWQPTASAA